MMSKSLEALDKLCDLATPDDDCLNYVIGLTMSIKQDLDLLNELKQRWNEEEWCKGVPLSASGLNSMFNYNLDLFNKNLELDKKNLDLEEELDIFKSAFYTLWKCCNSSECLTDDNKEDKFYVELKVGFENLFVAITEQELESIKKACEILDICLKEVLE